MADNEFDIITFDCYGTLIDWESGIVNAFQTEASRQNLSISRDEIIDAYHEEEPAVESMPYLSYREVLAQTGERVSMRIGLQIKPESKDFLSHSLPDWMPFPDTNPALERLAQRYRLGLLSNIDDDLLSKTRKLFTVEFDLIVTAQQVKSYKPAPAHFLEAITRTKGRKWLHAAQSYFHDVVPVRALNYPVAWVNRKRETIPEGGTEPTYEVQNLTELADLLEK
jgi:2-haloalkanoic acid dehalogenase type II